MRHTTSFVFDPDEHPHIYKALKEAPSGKKSQLVLDALDLYLKVAPHIDLPALVAGLQDVQQMKDDVKQIRQLVERGQLAIPSQMPDVGPGEDLELQKEFLDRMDDF